MSRRIFLEVDARTQGTPVHCIFLSPGAASSRLGAHQHSDLALNRFSLWDLVLCRFGGFLSNLGMLERIAQYFLERICWMKALPWKNFQLKAEYRGGVTDAVLQRGSCIVLQLSTVLRRTSVWYVGSTLARNRSSQ